VDYEGAYALVKKTGNNFMDLLVVQTRTEDVIRLNRTCEMILVRHYDDWYFGDPAPNISKSIHRYCEELGSSTNGLPRSSIRLAAMFLAWTYVRLEKESDDASLLLEHVLANVAATADDRTIAQQPLPAMKQALERWNEARCIPWEVDSLSVPERAIWDEIIRWEINPISDWTVAE